MSRARKLVEICRMELGREIRSRDRSARRQTERATCSEAAASPPPGRIKLRSGGSCASISSIHCSRSAVLLPPSSKLVRASRFSLDCVSGVATALPRSSSRDCTTLSCGTSSIRRRKKSLSVLDPVTAQASQCARARPIAAFNSSESPSAANTRSSFRRRCPLKSDDSPSSPVFV